MTSKRIQKQSDYQADRDTLIRRKLLGLAYWLYGRALLLPFCDYLKILLQRPDPVVITLWESTNRQRPLFSTHRSADTPFPEHCGAEIPHSSGLIVACYRLSLTSGLGDSAAGATLRQLFQHPDFTEHQDGVVFGDSLKQASVAQVPNRANGVCDAMHDETGGEVGWETALTSVFSSVSRVLESSPHFGLATPPVPGCINLFPFVFVAKTSINVTRPVLIHEPECFLTADQREFLRGKTGRVVESRRSFLDVFRSGAETAFQTGTVVLAPPVQDTLGGRKWPGFKTLASRHRIYVPIHVEGAPWIVLLKFLKDSEPSRWYDAFHFYDDVIPRIGVRLRAESKAAYLGHIERAFAQEVTNPDTPGFVSRFNTRCCALMKRYPFPEVRLVENARADANSLILSNGTVLCVATHDNPCFAPQVEYDPLDQQSVADACNRAQKTIEQSATSFEVEMRHQEHTIFQRVPTWDLEQAAKRSISELSGEARRHVEDANKLSDIRDISLTIAFERDTDLSLPGSVGELLTWLSKRTTSVELHAELVLPPIDEDFQLSKASLPSAFTVLWNLWHNASKEYGLLSPKCFWVSAGWCNGTFLVTFENEGTLSSTWRDYLINPTAPHPDPQKRGLLIVKTKMRALGWSIRSIDIADQRTRLTVVIAKKA